MLLFMDGQAHYDTAGIPLKYSQVDAINASWAVTSEGRFGNCIKRTATGYTGGSGLTIAPLMTRTGVWTPTASGVLGFAMKIDALEDLENSTIGLSNDLFRLVEGPSSHVRVHLNASGTMTLIRTFSGESGSGAKILAHSVEGFSDDTWYYIEFKWLIDAAAGTFEIRLNGVPVLTYAGRTLEEESLFNSLGVWNAVKILALEQRLSGGLVPPLTVRICDLYLADLVAVDGDDAHDFLGDGIIDTIMPNGVGATTGWTPSSGANWDATNDRPAHDGDGSYVASATVAAQDTYQFENIPTNATVKGVHINILARKEEEGSSAVAPVTHQGGVDYVGPTQGVASITYDRYITQPYDINPATLAPWTAAEVNAGQWGVKKVI